MYTICNVNKTKLFDFDKYQLTKCSKANINITCLNTDFKQLSQVIKTEPNLTLVDTLLTFDGSTVMSTVPI